MKVEKTVQPAGQYCTYLLLGMADRVREDFEGVASASLFGLQECYMAKADSDTRSVVSVTCHEKGVSCV